MGQTILFCSMLLNKNENEILAERIIHRASSGLYFLDACLVHIHKGGTDAAFSRSLYILFSFNFELILKSCVLLASKKIKREDLINEIKSHNLEKLSKKLSINDLKKIGVTKIQRKDDSGFTEYSIKMINGDEIFLQDLIDVRYDFGKEVLRSIDKDESTRMRGEAQVLIEMTKMIMKMI